MGGKTCLLLLLLHLQLLTGESLLDKPCEDWTAFKDEKCFKIFDQNLVDYADAENICKNEYEALLPSITTEEEQQFVENLIKTMNIVDNIWIGLKYVNNTYEWVDGSEAQYTHWVSGSPRNDSNYCAQIETETDIFGYWADVPCTKRNIIICEKLQLWSLQKIQSSLMEVMKNPVPIGFIYVQLPKEKAPQEIWPWMEWKDISHDYAGLFFRTEGGDAGSFGEIQDGSSPKLVKVEIHPRNLNESSGVVLVPADGTASVPLINLFESYNGTSCSSGVCTHGMQFTVSDVEVRPRNTAIKIWKRVL